MLEDLDLAAAFIYPISIDPLPDLAEIFQGKIIQVTTQLSIILTWKIFLSLTKPNLAQVYQVYDVWKSIRQERDVLSDSSLIRPSAWKTY